jgi:hypothetical protein
MKLVETAVQLCKYTKNHWHINCISIKILFKNISSKITKLPEHFWKHNKNAQDLSRKYCVHLLKDIKEELETGIMPHAYIFSYVGGRD